MSNLVGGELLTQEVKAPPRFSRSQPTGLKAIADLPDVVHRNLAYGGCDELQVADGFATALLAREPGSWQCPVRSGFGRHHVEVFDRKDSRIPEWTEVARRTGTGDNAGEEDRDETSHTVRCPEPLRPGRGRHRLLTPGDD